MCLYPKLIHTRDGKVRRVNCGHCQECMKIRQNDIAHRLWKASQHCTDIHFFTLTYANEHVPMYVRASDEWLEKKGYTETLPMPYIVPKEYKTDLLLQLQVDLTDAPKFYEKTFTLEPVGHYMEFGEKKDFNLLGEYIDDRKFDYDFSKKVRTDYWNKADRRCEPKHIRMLRFAGNDAKFGDYVVTPSLRNKDVCDVIKSFRKYDGKHKTLSPFKYFFCGEYGPQTDRPHYHMITYGLSDSEANMLLSRWIDRFGGYGSQWCSTVSRVHTEDYQTNHAAKAARYVGKYISKGVFECSNVVNKYAVRPRSVSSKDMYEVTKREFEYYSGKDILAPLADEFRSSDEYAALSDEMKSLYEERGLWRFLPAKYYTDDILGRISDRLYYTLPNDFRHYSLGNSIKNKIFKYVTYEKSFNYSLGVWESKRHLLSSPLSLKMSDFKSRHASELLLGQFGQLREQEDICVFDSVVVKKFREIQKVDRENREKTVLRSYKSQLQSSPY